MGADVGKRHLLLEEIMEVKEALKVIGDGWQGTEEFKCLLSGRCLLKRRSRLEKECEFGTEHDNKS